MSALTRLFSGPMDRAAASGAAGAYGGESGPAAAAQPVSASVRAAAAAAAGAMLAAGALHAVWVFTPWPLASRSEFATAVVGVTESELPSGPLTFAVAGLLGAAACLVASEARPEGRFVRSPVARAGLWTVTGVMAARGLGGLAASGLGLGSAPAEFRRWDLLLYSPLCVTLGGLTGYVAMRTRRR
ncbi:DUF3995 domain-containing protein [Streptomyces bambusae]|uniref:DUF3995 domain-containing protein n=1 Tax=Streptomyces bambusae TaxID=1550616 RepID=UPI001CFC7C3F|nr:DUF3995 domain-containing protein [Streptomyces bambusae]MCB5167455.1 DUF3995 domain-containing protein [Streptomyces bambusae]